MNFLLNWIWPKCPSGMDHRIRLDVVTNCLGNEYCYHGDCIQENNRIIDTLMKEKELADEDRRNEELLSLIATAIEQGRFDKALSKLDVKRKPKC